MYRQKSQPQTLSLFENQDETNSKSEDYVEKNEEKSVSEKTPIRQNLPTEQEKTDFPPVMPPEKLKSVNKIIVYYSDNTFEEFSSK